MWSYIIDHIPNSLHSRKDLGLEEHQIRLRAAKENGHEITCGCCEGAALKLFPVVLPADRGIVLRRSRRTDPHVQGCFAETLEPVFDSTNSSAPIVYPSNMLLEGAAVGEGRSAKAPTRPSRSGSRYEDFVHYFQSQFTRASLEAFAAANAGKSVSSADLANPHYCDVFLRLTDLFKEPSLDRGKESLETAARKIGVKIFFGISNQSLVAASDFQLDDTEVLEFGLGPHWECDGYHPEATTIELSPSVLEESRGKTAAMAHVIPPPYLYAAVARPMGALNRAVIFYRIPIAFSAPFVFPVESQAERRALTFLGQSGIPVLKLHVQCDLRILGPALWPYPTDQQGRLPSRPDVLAFAGECVHVLYLTDSMDPGYHEAVDRSVKQIREFFGPHAACARKISVDDLIANGLES